MFLEERVDKERLSRRVGRDLKMKFFYDVVGFYDGKHFFILEGLSE